MKTRTLRAAVIAAVLVLICAVCVLFVCLSARLALEWDRGGTIVQEYNDPYAPAAASARVIFPPTSLALKDIPVQVSDPVEPGKTGTYTVTAHAKFLWLEESLQYTVTLVDTQPPVIALAGKTNMVIRPGTAFVEPGYSAFDGLDGDLTDSVQVRQEGNTYIYTVSDRAGNTAEARRTVYDSDTVPPVITLTGGQEYHMDAGAPFVEPGFTATDNLDGNLTAAVQVSGTVGYRVVGRYPISYTVTDSFGNTGRIVRTVVVDPAPQPDSSAPDEKTIYLTFDDGPGQHTARLLDILKQYGVHATFFVTDSEYTDLLPRMAQEGHAIGVHTATHRYNDVYASEDAYFSDFETMQNRIFEATGKKTTMLRFPGGSSNTVSSFNPGIMTRLVQMVTDCGLQYYDWNVLSGDAGEVTTADEVYQNVVKGVTDRKYAIVLQHDIKGFSVDAVERIIQWGQENGYVFKALEPDSPHCHHRVNN